MAAREQGDHERALNLGREALRMIEAIEGPDHPDVANVLNHIGGMHGDRGEYAEAERAYGCGGGREQRGGCWVRAVSGGSCPTR